MAVDAAALFETIKQDPRYLRNLDWGEPRPGHPEGTVRAHIAEVGANIDRLATKVSPDEQLRLRILAHTHDSFKAEAAEGVPIEDPRGHASLAAAFLADLGSDPELIAAAQLHDVPYALWRNFEQKGRINETRLNSLLSAIQDWDLFLAFQIADGCTDGKSTEPLVWFLNLVAGRVQTRFGPADVLT